MYVGSSTPVLPAKVPEAQKISSRSLSIPVPSRTVEDPAPDLDSMMTKGKLKRVLPLPSDALRASKSVISVSGKAYAIPCQPDGKYLAGFVLAEYFSYLPYGSPFGGRFGCSFPAR